MIQLITTQNQGFLNILKFWNKIFRRNAQVFPQKNKDLLKLPLVSSFNLCTVSAKHSFSSTSLCRKTLTSRAYKLYHYNMSYKTKHCRYYMWGMRHNNIWLIYCLCLTPLLSILATKHIVGKFLLLVDAGLTWKNHDLWKENCEA